jgi:hypothetical protein
MPSADGQAQANGEVELTDQIVLSTAALELAQSAPTPTPTSRPGRASMRNVAARRKNW